MKSGDPAPLHDLKLTMDMKRNTPSPTMEVVGEASQWLKGQFKGAGVPFEYFACEEPHYGYAEFTLVRMHGEGHVALSLKVAEVMSRPYVFAEVVSLGKAGGTMFPYFGDVRSEEGRTLLLHYVADFLMSTGA